MPISSILGQTAYVLLALWKFPEVAEVGGEQFRAWWLREILQRGMEGGEKRALIKGSLWRRGRDEVFFLHWCNWGSM